MIKRQLGEDGWQRARRAWNESSIIALDEELSVFRSYKIYLVRGDTGQFDFPSLPRCSYAFFAANGSEAVRLSRAGKEIQGILAKDWPSFATANPVYLASLILRFFDNGIKATHQVLADAADLQFMCSPPREFHLDANEFANVFPEIGVTSCSVKEKLMVLRAITLLGWMHEKKNLGIEVLSIRDDGCVTLSKRRVLSARIFDRVPAIAY
jgi:hypothetical protein